MKNIQVILFLAALLQVTGSAHGQDLPGSARPDDAPVVVLLHGLARSASSMSKMGAALTASGFRVCNVSYPSRKYTIEVLASEYVPAEIARCVGDSRKPLNFVTHSMGGIIVRQLAASGRLVPGGRVVMLSPPNHGSEVVNALGNWSLFTAINGPAGSELGTAAASLPNRLGPASFEVGIITGNSSINWILSAIIPGPDDGKVSVSSARLDGMKAFLVIPSSHPFIMNNPTAIEQTIFFLKHGTFSQDGVQTATPADGSVSRTPG